MKIEESIKVSSWGKEFHPSKPDHNHQIFQKYAQTQKNTYEMEEDLVQYPSEEIQISTIQGGFRKLKNQQIEKLKDLKSEYQEIRKIATDYAVPRGSRTPSMQSSSQSIQSASREVLSPKGSKMKLNSNREVQILELQKKQLEIMVENSMKKIEQLLHNQMQYKKTIHQYKLQRESKSGSEGDNEALSKLLKRRQKDFNERVKALQLQRQTFFSTMATYKDRIKYLESSLANSEQQLRKILDQKRNFEELIRMQKDRYMNLQIELRRQKREHEIIEKDKNAEINRLLKLKDIKESSTDRQLRSKINDLQDELKVKDERYNILLDKFQTYQKQEKQRLRQEKEKEKQKEKEQQIRVVNQILSKSTSIDPQNKALQQTITNILQRVVDLQRKPIIEIDNIVNHQHQAHQEILRQLQLKNAELLKQLEEKQRRINQIKSENQRMAVAYEKLQREIRDKAHHQLLLSEQIEKLKKFERTFRKDKSGDRLNQVKIKTEPSYSYPPINNKQIRSLQTKLSLLSKDYQQIRAQKALLQQQNRSLRLTISQLQFQVQKREKQKFFSLGLQEKAYNSKYEDLSSTNLKLKQQITTLTNQLSSCKQQLTTAKHSSTEELQRLNQTIQMYRRQKNNMSVMIKDSAVASINQVRSENNTKINELTSTIEKLTIENEKCRQSRQEYFALLQENQRLIQLLKQMRYVNGQCDRLWNAKQMEYERVDGILRAVKR